MHETHGMKSRQDMITVRDRLRQWKLLHVRVGFSQLSGMWSACLIMNRFSQSIISGISPLPWNAAAEVSGPQAVVSCLLFLSAFSFSPWKNNFERKREREGERGEERERSRQRNGGFKGSRFVTAWKQTHLYRCHQSHFTCSSACWYANSSVLRRCQPQTGWLFASRRNSPRLLPSAGAATECTVPEEGRKQA